VVLLQVLDHLSAIWTADLRLVVTPTFVVDDLSPGRKLLVANVAAEVGADADATYTNRVRR